MKRLSRIAITVAAVVMGLYVVFEYVKPGAPFSIIISTGIGGAFGGGFSTYLTITIWRKLFAWADTVRLGQRLVLAIGAPALGFIIPCVVIPYWYEWPGWILLAVILFAFELRLWKTPKSGLKVESKVVPGAVK